MQRNTRGSIGASVELRRVVDLARDQLCMESGEGVGRDAGEVEQHALRLAACGLVAQVPTSQRVATEVIRGVLGERAIVGEQAPFFLECVLPAGAVEGDQPVRCGRGAHGWSLDGGPDGSTENRGTVQLVEVSDAGVRVAVYRVAPRGEGPVFVLFPMLHAGTAAYYEEIARRLEECDAIFMEGVSSRRIRHMTVSYRVLARIKRLDLVTQHSMDLSRVRHKMVGTDVTGKEFEERWDRVPWWFRALLALVIPVYVAYLWLYGTRAFLARRLELNDLPSRDEVLQAGEELEAMDEAIMGSRDRRLLEHVEGAARNWTADGPKVVGVVWWAHHMRAVTRLLLWKLKYRVVSAEWVTAFTV